MIMLTKLRHNRRLAKLLRLVESDELELWPGLRDQLSEADLLAPLESGISALELCVERGHHRLLKEILFRFPSLNSAILSGQRTLIEAVMQSEARLALLSAMLSCGLDANECIGSESLVELALEQPAEVAMLLVNRLAQHGADMTNPQLLIKALQTQDPALLKFLVDSGAQLDLESAAELAIDAELLAFTKRAIEDKRIRDLWA